MKDFKENFQKLVNDCISAHCFSVKPSKAVRKWDGKTPYSVHPIWCATMILHETALAEEIRVDGSQALLFHDVLEDTLAELPNYLSDRVKKLVQDMTFESSDEEMLKVWDKPIEVKLFKLYDKVSNLMDASWMSPEKLRKYREYTNRLTQEVQTHYGELNIVKLAKILAADQQ